MDNQNRIQDQAGAETRKRRTAVAIIAAALLSGSVVSELASTNRDDADRELDRRVARVMRQWTNRPTEVAVLRSRFADLDPVERTAQAVVARDSSARRVGTERLAAAEMTETSGRVTPTGLTVEIESPAVSLSGHRERADAAIVRGRARIHAVANPAAE